MALTQSNTGGRIFQPVIYDFNGCRENVLVGGSQFEDPHIALTRNTAISRKRILINMRNHGPLLLTKYSAFSRWWPSDTLAYEDLEEPVESRPP